jgi:hypothetical protein
MKIHTAIIALALAASTSVSKAHVFESFAADFVRDPKIETSVDEYGINDIQIQCLLG